MEFQARCTGGKPGRYAENNGQMQGQLHRGLPARRITVSGYGAHPQRCAQRRNCGKIPHRKKITPSSSNSSRSKSGKITHNRIRSGETSRTSFPKTGCANEEDWKTLLQPCLPARLSPPSPLQTQISLWKPSSWMCKACFHLRRKRLSERRLLHGHGSFHGFHSQARRRGKSGQATGEWTEHQLPTHAFHAPDPIARPTLPHQSHPPIPRRILALLHPAPVPLPWQQ